VTAINGPLTATAHLSNVADPDPGSGVFLTPGSGIGKKTESGSGMNNPDHISEKLRNQFFGLKLLKLFDADPGWEKFGSGIEKILIRDPG
jgi:hypothetical protein